MTDMGERGMVDLNLDTGAQTGDEIMARAHFSASNVLLQGPKGNVPVTLEARVNKSAHSCAGAGVLLIQAINVPLPAGDYTLVVLLDQVTWRPTDDDVTTWQGHPALVRRYAIK